MKKIDPEFCASSFLMFRTIVDRNRSFAEGINEYHILPPPSSDRKAVRNSEELEAALRENVKQTVCNGKAALALSAGIDSAILAKMMPKGSVAYTFKCVVPGMEVIDETIQAARYAEECGLEHRVVEIYWDDMVRFAPELMRHKGAPIHSIEVQIYKAAIRALNDGFETMIYGESADCLYGGMSDLLSKDRTVGNMINRYSYVLPYEVLKNPELIIEPYLRFEKDGFVDVHEFLGHVFYEESTNSYENACATAGIKLLMPFAKTRLQCALNLKRVRNGENKYLVREVFHHLYPGWDIPKKTPMPRPLNEWMKNWEGPKRPEFWPHCTDEMTGDQKWYVYALERFLDMI